MLEGQDIAAGNAPADGALATTIEGLEGEDTSWLTDFHIDDPATLEAAPLPADALAEGADKTPADVAAKESVKKDDTVVADPPAAKAPDQQAAAAADQEPELELTPAEKETIDALPEAERAEAVKTVSHKRHFMDHYTGDTPIEKVAEHLEQVSPSRFAGITQVAVDKALSQPSEFCRSYFEANPDGYNALAREVFNGAPELFTKMVVGEARDPQEVKTALEFYDRNKDRITDDATEGLGDDKLAEIEHYFGPEVRAQVEAGNRALADKAATKSPADEQAKPDAAKPDQVAAEQAQQLQVAQEVNSMWDLTRDTVSNHIAVRAMDPEKGAGVHVTAAERAAAPETTAGRVALLKDWKMDVLANGLVIDGKPLLPDFQSGLTEWAKDRPGFKEALLTTKRYADAREKQNVLSSTEKMFPFSDAYYEDRLKHPIFKAIDDLIALAAKSGNAEPKVDRHVAGALPSAGASTAKGAASNANAHSDDYLIADAVSRK